MGRVLILNYDNNQYILIISNEEGITTGGGDDGDGHDVCAAVEVSSIALNISYYTRLKACSSTLFCFLILFLLVTNKFFSQTAKDHIFYENLSFYFIKKKSFCKAKKYIDKSIIEKKTISKILKRALIKIKLNEDKSGCYDLNECIKLGLDFDVIERYKNDIPDSLFETLKRDYNKTYLTSDSLNRKFIQLVDKCYYREQYLRTKTSSEVKKNTLKKVDSLNRVEIFDWISKKGFPSSFSMGFDTKRKLDIVVLHCLTISTIKYSEYYDSILKKAALSGDFDIKWYAVVKDRFYISKTGKQYYGSYNVKGSKITEVHYPEKVDSLRFEIGMLPLTMYLEIDLYRDTLPNHYRADKKIDKCLKKHINDTCFN